MNAEYGSGRIYWIGGGKGGVGKSMMTLATLDFLLERGAKVVLVGVRHIEPRRVEGVPRADGDGAH